MRYKYILTFDWSYRGPVEEHYTNISVQPYNKSLKAYIGYCCIGGAYADGIEINGYHTLKECLNQINPKYINEIKFFDFNKKQKRHLIKVLNKIKECA